MNPSDLLHFIPEKYRPVAIAAIALSPYVTRTAYALMRGHGIKGVLCAIWLGTNVPSANPKLQTSNSTETTNTEPAKAGTPN